MEINRYIHDRIFNYLIAKNESDPNFLFRLRRSNRFDRLAKGFWFHGNEKYLALSFWSGSDWKNKTPNISFLFVNDGEVYLELSAKDSDVKTYFFINEFKDKDKKIKVSGDEKYINSTAFENDGLGMKFLKKLNLKWNISNLDSILGILIKDYKKEIDSKIKNWLINKPKQESNRLGFIDKNDFKKLSNRIKEYQKILREKEILDNPFSITTETVIYKYLDGEYDKKLDDKLKILLDDLPISISEINISKYKELENIQIENISKNKQWIFITGENGAGKSSLLEAIIIGLNGNIDNNLILNSNEFKVKLSVNKDDTLINNAVERNTFIDGETFTKINEFACYGPNRFDISSSPSTSSIDYKGKTFNLFNGNGKLLNIEEALIKWELKADLFDYYNSFLTKTKSKKTSNPDYDNPYSFYEKYFNIYSQIKEIFIGKGEDTDDYTPGLLPSVVEMASERTKDDDKIYYSIRTELEGKKKSILFNELSTGNKSLVAMIGDLILRFIERSHILTPFEFPDPSEFEGIVLIDEIDAHIHPKWQMTIPKLLSDIFPRLQFIVTCHSPIPFMGIPDKDRSVFIKLKKDENQNILAEQLDYLDLKELTPETILTSPLFDFENLYGELDSNLRFSTEKDYNEEVFNRLLDKKLNALANKLKK
jgi:predicted ATP-binding protein involved in virulence